MVNRKRSFILLSAAIAILFATSSSALACGRYSSIETSTSNDSDHVSTSAAAHLSDLCQRNVTTTVTSPDNSTSASSSTALQQNGKEMLSTTAGMAIETSNGPFPGLGSYHSDGQDSALGQGTVKQNENQAVSPFIKITSWSVNPPTVGLHNASLTFTARVLASTNCQGTVEMSASLTAPTGAQIQWTAPSQGNTIAVEHSFAGGDSFNYSFTATMNTQNMVTGEGTATAYFSSWPAACTRMGDNQTATYTITNP